MCNRVVYMKKNNNRIQSANFSIKVGPVPCVYSPISPHPLYQLLSVASMLMHQPNSEVPHPGIFYYILVDRECSCGEYLQENAHKTLTEYNVINTFLVNI